MRRRVKNLFLDTETYSPTDLKSAGTYRYAELAEVMLVQYAVDDGPVTVIDRTNEETYPNELLDAIADERVTVTAHNAQFDMLMLPKAGIEIPLERWRCSMARALSHSLPGGLAILCQLFGITDGKLDGKSLIQLFCKPRPKNMALRRATRPSHPTEWAEFKRYAAADIHAMQLLDRKMPRWNYPDNPTELLLWHLDMQKNRRGFAVDTELATHCVRAVAAAQKDLAARTQETTGYDATTGAGVKSTNQRDKLLAYLLAEHGVDLPDLQKSTLERRINDESLPRALRELLVIRLEASSVSVAKYKALLRSVSADGRLRGTTQFNGAARTGRDAHRLFQPGNMARPTVKDYAEIEYFIDTVKHGAEYLATDKPIELASNAVRGCIVAPAGKQLAVADLAGIEGRVAAWVAGEEWKLQAYRDYDAGKGADMYKLAYAKAFNVSVDEVDKAARQIGKVMELFLQYEGGVGAFLTGSLTYNIDLDHMAEAVYPTLPDHILDDAWGFHAWTVKKNRPTFDLEPKTFVACDSLKRMWRAANPKIAETWAGLKDTVASAIRNPGAVYEYKCFRIAVSGAWLRIRLPSGRFMCYAFPEVGEKDELSYFGINSYTRKWCRIKTYGGKLLENPTQAIARDVMKYAEPAVVAAGYDINLEVHDEMVTEVGPLGSAEQLCQLMTAGYEWSKGLPLAAEGFTAKRYRK
jgi:DNA polymerase